MANTTKEQLKGVDGLFRKQENQIELVIALVLIIVLALSYFVFAPMYRSYAASNIEIANLAVQRQTLEDKKTNLLGLKDLIASRTSFIASVQDILPVDQQVPEVLFTLEKIATKNGLALTDFTPRLREEQREVITNPETGETSVRVANQYRTVQLDFNLTGSYDQVKQFVLDLQNNIRPIDIQSISINGGGELQRESGTPSPLRFSVTAHTYFQPEGQ